MDIPIQARARAAAAGSVLPVAIINEINSMTRGSWKFGRNAGLFCLSIFELTVRIKSE
jgi:hypothetical protein